MNCNTYMLSCKLLQLDSSHEARNPLSSQHVLFPCLVAGSCLLGLLMLVGVLSSAHQLAWRLSAIRFHFAWVRVFFNARRTKYSWNQPFLPICEDVFFEVSRWSPLWVTVYHLQTTPLFFYFLPSALELPLSKSKSAVFPLSLLTRLWLHWVCSKSFVCFGLRVSC